VGAKVLLIVTFISIPFLISDVAILVAHGLPVSAGGLVWRQVVVGSVYLLPMAALASVTRYYAQIAITLVAGLLLFVFMQWGLDSQGGLWGPLEWMPALIVGAFLFTAGLGVVAWQYAERRSWAGRGVLIATVELCVATPRLHPLSAAVALVSSDSAPEDLRPVQLRFASRSGRLENVQISEWFSLRVEGAPAQMQAEPDLLKVTIHGARGNLWDSGWRPQDSAYLFRNFTTTWLWEGSDMANNKLNVVIGEELATRLRPVGTRIEVAMTLYRIGARVPIPPDGHPHEIPGIGICSLARGAFGQQVLGCDSAGYPSALVRIYGADGRATTRGPLGSPQAIPLRMVRWYAALFDLSPVFRWSTEIESDASQMLTVEWPVAHIRRDITLDRPWQRVR
jgi:hypothetical protein